MRQVNKRTAGHPSCYLYTSDTSTRRLLPFLAVVRQGNSVPETPSYGTELALGAQNSLLRYATHFLKHSVLKTGFSGTAGIFGTGNTLLRYGMKRPNAAIVWIALGRGCDYCRSGSGAGTTLRLLPMESVLTASWERLSGYNAAAVSPDSHCCGVRETPLAAVITNNPTYRENFHTPRNAPPRGKPSPPRNTPSPTKKSTARNTPNPKTHYHHPKNTPSPQVPRQRRELQ